VVNHIGESIQNGHYTAACRDVSKESPLGSDWRLFNDLHVSTIDEFDVHSSSAYMLFYVRNDTLPCSAFVHPTSAPPDTISISSDSGISADKGVTYRSAFDLTDGNKNPIEPIHGKEPANIEKDTFAVFPPERETTVSHSSVCLQYVSQIIALFFTDTQDAIRIFHSDLDKLDPRSYLNDNLIDFQLRHTILTTISPSRRRSVHAFNCMFYQQLTGMHTTKACHELVKNWTKRFDLFRKSLLLVPIYYDYHWSLAVIVHPGAVEVRVFCFVINVTCTRN